MPIDLTKITDETIRKEVADLIGDYNKKDNELKLSKEALEKTVNENKTLRESNADLYTRVTVGTQTTKKEDEEVDEEGALEKVLENIKNYNKP